MLKNINIVAIIICLATNAPFTQAQEEIQESVSVSDQILNDPAFQLTRFMFDEAEKNPQKLEAILNDAADKQSPEEFARFLQHYYVYDFQRANYGGLLFDIIERISDTETQQRCFRITLKIARHKLNHQQFLALLNERFYTTDSDSELNGLTVLQFAQKTNTPGVDVLAWAYYMSRFIHPHPL